MFDRLFDFLYAFVEVFSFTTIVDEYEQAVLLRLGRFKKVLKPGLHFIYPLRIDTVYKENVVQETQSVGSQSLTSLDGKSVLISAVLTYKIRDIRKYMLEVEDAAGVLEDSTYAVVADAIEEATWDQIRQPGFSAAVHKDIRTKAFRWGIEVISLQFSDKSLSKTLRLIKDE